MTLVLDAGGITALLAGTAHGTARVAPILSCWHCHPFLPLRQSDAAWKLTSL